MCVRLSPSVTVSVCLPCFRPPVRPSVSEGGREGAGERGPWPSASASVRACVRVPLSARCRACLPACLHAKRPERHGTTAPSINGARAPACALCRHCRRRSPCTYCAAARARRGHRRHSPCSLHRLRSRPCSQRPPPPQSLHLLRRRPCSQRPLPPQSLQLLRSRPCSHFFFPIPTFVHEVRRRDVLVQISTWPTRARAAPPFWLPFRSLICPLSPSPVTLLPFLAQVVLLAPGHCLEVSCATRLHTTHHNSPACRNPSRPNSCGGRRRLQAV